MRLFAIICMPADFEIARHVYASLNESELTTESPRVGIELVETVGPGPAFSERLSQYIEDGLTDLVLLWSRDLTRSTWIRWEFNEAQQLRLEDLGVSLRLIRVDDAFIPRSTRRYIAPLDMRHDVHHPARIAQALLKPPSEPPRPRRILNRGEESEAIEKAFYSSNIRTLWLWGVAGVGKRSIALETATRLKLLSRTRRVEIGPGTAREELDVLIAAELGVETLSRPYQRPEGRDEALLKVRGDTVDLIMNLARAGGIWIFAEVQHWLDDAGEPLPILQHILDACNNWSFDSSHRLIIFTSRRKPALREDWLRWTAFARVSGLSRFYAVQLLRERGSPLKNDDLSKVARQLAGHPLALEIAARELTLVPPDWEEERVRLATELIAGAPLSSDAKAILEVIAAVDGPIPGAEIGGHLGFSSDGYRRAVDEAVSYSLIDVDREGYLQCHELASIFRAPSQLEVMHT
jgi:hypothetical protein